jgi:tetraacyldisaccharide 4'-kinase
VFVLDDGFQHRRLKRDLDIVCLHDSPAGDRLMPLGWLREPAAALSRARAALIIGTAERSGALEALRTELASRFPGLCTAVLFQETGPWVSAAGGPAAAGPPEKDPLLVCGIARPERFTAAVRAAGIAPCAELIFPDHHRYTLHDFSGHPIVYSKCIITTEKDAVRLRSVEGLPAGMIWFPKIRLRFADEQRERELFSLVDAAADRKEKRS